MIRPDDQNIICAESAMPALSWMLDDSRVAEYVSRRASGGAAVHATYVRYKPATSCVVAYSIDEGAPPVLYARTHVDAAKMAKVRSKYGPQAVVDFGTPGGPAPVALFEFPTDDELPALGRVSDDTSRRALLEHLLPANPEYWEATLEVLSYKPERRLVGRLTAPDGRSVAVRFHAEGEFDRQSRHPRVFKASPHVEVPRMIRRSQRHRATVTNWIEGAELRDPSGRDQVHLRVGAALADLHQQQPRLTHTYSASMIAEEVRNAASAIMHLCPDWTQRLARVQDQLTGALTDDLHTTASIHGDFTPDQILVTERGVAVLDFDRAGNGDPRLDLGQYAARLICGRHRSDDGVSPDVARMHLLQGYERAGGAQVAGTIEPFIALGLLKFAVLPFRTRQPSWMALMERTLHDVEESVCGSGAC